MGHRQPGRLAFCAQVQAFSVNKFNLGDTDKAQDIAHEIGLGIRGATGITAARVAKT